MPRGINLGEFFGVPVRLHYTWFVALPLIALALVVYFHGIYPLWLNVVHGVVAGLLYLGSVCLRELAHSFVAINRGMPVRSVTLYVFGGVPRINEQDTRPIPELLVAVAGPLSSLIIAGVFFALRSLLAGLEIPMAAEFMQWLFFFNIVMALFNLIPAFPLDGGRGLRAILLMALNDYCRATRIAALTGRVIGFLLIALGIFMFVSGGGWLASTVTLVFGWFLEEAARVSYRQALVHGALQGIVAYDMMTQEYTPVKQQLTFGVVREYIINSGQHCFTVIEDGKLQGLVTLSDIQIPEKRWNSTRISDIMTPASKLKTARPDQPVVDLLEQMDDYDIDQIPVVREDRLIGMVTRERLLRFLKARAVLKA